MKRLALLASAMGLALAAGAAQAQTEPQGDAAEVEGVTVTAQKREQDILDVGASVSVASAAQIEARRVEQVRDLQTLTANLDVKEQVPGAMPVITIRGVGLDDFSSTNNPSAGIYIDEVYMASLAQMNFDLFDLERIEVLRGPQGTLYGRNSTAGALNIVTARPSFGGFAARVAGTYGNYDRWELEGMVNLPVSDTFALRLAAKTIQQDEGFWFNRTIGRDIGRRDIWLGRIQARWAPAEGWDLVLKLEAQRSRSELGQSEFFGAFPHPGFPGVTCPGDPRCSDFFGYADGDGDPFTGDWAPENFYDIDQWGTTLRVNRTLGDYTLTSVTGYADFERAFYIDVDAGPLRQTEFIQADRIRQFSQELRLSADTDRVDWVLGAFYSDDDVHVDNPGFFQDLFNTTLFSQFDQSSRSAAAFGSAEWRLRDNLSLVTGLRVTWERKHNVGFNDDLVSLCPASFLTLVPCGAGPVRLAQIDATIEDTNWSWRLGLNWHPDPLTLVYASATQGVKSGGFFSGVATSNAQLAPYRPETLIAYEIGWRRRAPSVGLEVSASAFYYDYREVQTFIQDTSGGLPVQRLGNVDEATLYGADFELSWSPPSHDALALQANLGLLHTELGDFVTSAGPVAAGNRLPNAPSVTFNVQARYDIPVTGDWRVRLIGAAHHSGDVFKDAVNDPLLHQDNYWSFDGRVALIDDAWEFALWGRNLSDEQHLVQGLNLLVFGYGNRTYSAPRTFGVTISRRW